MENNKPMFLHKCEKFSNILIEINSSWRRRGTYLAIKSTKILVVKKALIYIFSQKAIVFLYGLNLSGTYLVVLV